ncbi:DUF6968 family protein [Nocardia sp. NPDC004068]|uniref:DUF6968 family protein n=1 Tax=Nocardia sp. NPDC004068 TaxID=3364303 RepID=UPI0036BB18C0
MTDKPIATRTLRRIQSGGEEVTVEVFAPAVQPDGAVACRYLITGLNPTVHEGTSWGVDDIQALVSALTTIGAILRRHDDLRFLDTLPADSGFPHP